jgi:hypothetical protein
MNKDNICIATFTSNLKPIENPVTDKPADLPNIVPTDDKPIDAATELAIDGNGDGILDNEQIYVITIPDAINGEYITLATNNCPIQIISAHTGSELENKDYSFPQGIIYYELQCEKVNIIIYFHSISSFKTKPIYQKYGPLVPGDLSTLSWYTLPNVNFGITTINDKQMATVKFTLVDGKLGDNTGVDGLIIDPGGVAFEDVKYNRLTE